MLLGFVFVKISKKITRKRDAGQNSGATKIPLPYRRGIKKQTEADSIAPSIAQFHGKINLEKIDYTYKINCLQIKSLT